MKKMLTMNDVVLSIHSQFNGKIIPHWKLRRVMDSLESSGSLSVQRIGGYRTISADDVHIVAEELQRLGWLEAEAAHA